MATSEVSINTFELVANSLEGILYGFSVFMFGATVFALMHSDSNYKIRHGMLGVACTLLILSTIHLIVSNIRIEDGFITFRDTFPGGSSAYFVDLADPTYILKNAIVAAQIMVGDGVLTYRCYMVWQSFWIAVLPILGWFTALVSSIMSLHLATKTTSHSSKAFLGNLDQWGATFYASTFATNLVSTGLLSYRIWSINRRTADIRLSRRGLMPIVRIFIDSGLLYSANLLATLVCFVLNSNGQRITNTIICPITSIAFYMIIVRLVITNKNLFGRDTDWRMSAMHYASAPNQGLQVRISHLRETMEDSEVDGAQPFPKTNGDSREYV